jgi:protein O-GlcNAc transferase
MYFAAGRGAITEKALCLLRILFHTYDGILPGICSRDLHGPLVLAVGVQSGLGPQKIIPTVLLTQSRSPHDKGVPILLFLPDASGWYIPSSHTLDLILHYLALALRPTSSTYNNISILMPLARQMSTTTNVDGKREIIYDGTSSRLYHNKGFVPDPQFPYLMTNLASSLKHQGQVLVAFRQALKQCISLSLGSLDEGMAIQAKPDFGVDQSFSIS